MTTDKDKDKLKQRATCLTRRRGSKKGIPRLDDVAGSGNWKSSPDQQRHSYRRRLRRLFKKEAGKSNANNNKKSISSIAFSWSLKPYSHASLWYCFWLLMSVAVISMGCALFTRNQNLAKFMQSYTNQYHDIVHNKLNYCDRSVNLSDMFTQLREHVVNQDTALYQLERALSNNQPFQSIALIGSSGLGKSLSTRLLQEMFPWRENVQAINWQNHLEEEIGANWSNFQFSYCGRNLLLIDNMTPSDLAFVKIINDAVQQRADVTYQNNSTNHNSDAKYVTIIYIFNINRMTLSNRQYEDQLNQLQQELPQPTHWIPYRSFQKKDLEQCIRHDVKLENLYISENYVEEMLNTTDVEISGCKTVHAKVLIYGTREED